MSENADRESIVSNEIFFGIAIQEARLQQGLSQAELADRIGAHRSYLSALENGRSTTAVRTLMRAVRELQLELVLRPRR